MNGNKVPRQLAAVLALIATAVALGAALSSALSRQIDEALDSAMVLVATATLDKGIYRESVLLAIPRVDGGHVGFVLNRPLSARLSDLFPEDEAARGVPAVVHVGGPYMSGAIFALVRGPALELSDGVIRVSPSLHVAYAETAVDQVIASRPTDARFFVGLVAWRPGELGAELRAGAWEVHAADPDTVLAAESATLWEQLASRVAPGRRARNNLVKHRSQGVPLLAFQS